MEHSNDALSRVIKKGSNWSFGGLIEHSRRRRGEKNSINENWIFFFGFHARYIPISDLANATGVHIGGEFVVPRNNF